jgi:hypothetical protein
MGWDYTMGMSIKELKAERRAGAEKMGYKQLGEATRGNRWYRALEAPSGDKFIAVYLVERRKGYGAGYKSMDEDMHPFFYDCPMKLLFLAERKPELQSEGSREWREKVGQYHAIEQCKKIRKLLDGKPLMIEVPLA